MALNDFVKKWAGQNVDANGNVSGDPAFGQCVDLANLWLINLGIDPIFHKDAKDFPFGLSSDISWFGNSPNAIPEAGDLVVWGTGLNPHGHIAVFVYGDANSFTSFDQNYPKYSPCHLQNHNYKNVIGWLCPKKGEQVNAQQVYYLLEPFWRKPLHGNAEANHDAFMRDCQDIANRINGGENWVSATYRDKWLNEFIRDGHLKRMCVDNKICSVADCSTQNSRIATLEKFAKQVKTDVNTLV